MQEGQLDGVLDRFDLRAEPPDVHVGDVGHLFQDELFDLRLRKPLEHVPGANVEHQMVAGAQAHRLQRVGEVHDALLVGVTDHDRAR